MILTGERQIAPTLSGIRRDHVARYEFAARVLAPGSRVCDFACGIGYGTAILAEAGHVSDGFDRDADAVAYGRKFYAHERARLHVSDAMTAIVPRESFDAAVCFETIEHVPDPAVLLRKLHAAAPLLIASVPNEEVIPKGDGYGFHYQHFYRHEFEELLVDCGWEVSAWYGQTGPEAEVEQDVNGRTLIAVARRKEDGGMDEVRNTNDDHASQVTGDASAEACAPGEDQAEDAVAAAHNSPDHVAILGLGPSLEQYVNIVKRLGGKHAYCDETWGINAVGGVIMCDVVFHMDDVRIQEIRAKARPQSNIARMLEWMRVHPGPIVTSRAHPDYPGLVEFPLETALNALGSAYFNSTAAYAVAYAIMIGVKRISIFGCDYTYPNAHDAEKGRACVEYWLGMAAARGIKVTVAKSSTLLDAMHPQEERLYGYDTLDVTIRNEGGLARVDLVERATLPSADDIEARYDHTQHPNALVSS